MRGHSHLATRSHDVDRAVLVRDKERAIRRWWLAELVDFMTKHRDVFLRSLKCGAQLFILSIGVGQLPAHLKKVFFEHSHAMRGLGNPMTKLGYLLFRVSKTPR